MSVYDKAHELARMVHESEEYREMTRLKERAMEDATNQALLSEYKRLQAKLQLTAMSQGQIPQDETQRFQQLATLLFMNNDVQAYLLAEMRFQKMIADLVKIISEGAGFPMDALDV